MTKELGWTEVGYHSYLSGIHLMGFPKGIVNKQDIVRIGEDRGIEMRFDTAVKKPVPDYLNGLNACAEMESHLGDKWHSYCNQLKDITLSPQENDWKMTHATEMGVVSQ